MLKSTSWFHSCLSRFVLAVPLGILLSSCGIAPVTSAIYHDLRHPLPATQPGQNDASRMYSNQATVFTPSSDPELAAREISRLIRSEETQGKKISVSGARHSMGGHTFTPGGVVINMLPVNRLSFDPSTHLLTAGAGARWSEVIPYLDSFGKSVAVMQSNNDFSIGGSISVNCHGWQPDSPPIASTVEAFTIVTADGKIRDCSRRQNPELFSLALGGYGLFGIITDVKLRVTDNARYRATTTRTSLSNYHSTYESMIHQHDAGMAYGRISVAKPSYLNEALITVLEKQSGEVNSNSPEASWLSKLKLQLARKVFRSGVGNEYGKELRWNFESHFGGTANSTQDRNQIMNLSADWFANRDPSRAEILHEYFVPPDSLDAFVEHAREIIPRYPQMDLLNITVRKVRADPDTYLRYARQDRYALVILFNYANQQTGDDQMRKLTQDLIDAVLACDGSYYLPYRPHATLRQFQQAYPNASHFAALKRKYDPTDRFSNLFWQKYLLPLAPK
ncbi:FAD-binding oxidoreductase [Luteolibacter pohnpeiensis]|uniref:FAD-binding oxidoreductase n=1 Tax=Luteolibacter pohnpeiensis TaxID=454153 RepID=A0A934S5W3_9BACT|nr:FAD-binding oxidoreductase [Luteolibacter pohnpeiensis]MBK1882812.1 FAD-binding oxidoreductase [Luteolibacter pohnpeiensis]